MFPSIFSRCLIAADGAAATEGMLLVLCCFCSCVSVALVVCNVFITTVWGPRVSGAKIREFAEYNQPSAKCRKAKKK